MADWYTLIALSIEDPIQPTSAYPQTLGFTDKPEGAWLASGTSEPDRRFEPGLLDAPLPVRSGDLYGKGGMGASGMALKLSLDTFPAVDLLAGNVRLQRIRARVYWWRAGDALDQAQLVWKGQVASPVIDIEGNVFSCSLAAATREVDAPFPGAKIGDDGRFATNPDQASDQVLPVIYGTVKGLPAFRITEDFGPVPPAVPGSFTRFAVAGHRVPSQSVNLIFREDGASYGAFAVTTERDSRGDEYAEITVLGTVTGPGGELWEKDGTVWLDSIEGWTGAVGQVERLGDVLIHLVRTYAAENSLELDWSRISAATSHLNRFKVACAFNAGGGSLLRLLSGRFQQQFPVVFGWARGLFGWDFADMPPGSGSMGEIIWRHNAHERGVVTPVPDSLLRSRFEIGYGVDLSAGGNTAALRVDKSSNARCAGAEHRWGVSPVLRIEAPDAADAGTATLLADDLINRLTKRRLRVSYVVDEPTWISLPLFARLAITDDDLGWVERSFLLEGVAPVQPGRLRLALVSEDGI